jgi:hypothetical protein
MIEIRGKMDSADELAFHDAVAAQREALYGVEFVRYVAPGKH